MLPTSGQISAAQISYFALIVPPLIFVLVHHGRSGVLGWFFLGAFCALRIVGGAMVVYAESHGTFSSTGALISQIGLSPLAFALTGILHEASRTVVHRSRLVLGWPLQVLTHAVALAGLPLVVVGATNAATPGMTPDQILHAVALLRAGAALFLLVFLLIAVQLVVSVRQPRAVLAERRLLIAAGAAMPEFLLRVLYLVLPAIINSASWSVLGGGSIAERAVLEVVPEFVMALALVGGGVATRHLPSDRAVVPQDGVHEMTEEQAPDTA